MGAHLQVDSGLSGESVRTKQILRCDDAETDARVNRESCHALGIASVMVMPLMREQEVMGVFELFSGRVSAFEERDIVALQRIAEMIQTAVDHAESTERGEKQIASAAMGHAAEELTVEVEVEKAEPASEVVPAGKTAPPAKAVVNTADAIAAPIPVAAERLNIHTCSKCGFPVSGGRSLCLDCEAKEGDTAGAAYIPQFGTGELEEKSWLRSHWYVMGILVVAAIVVGVLLRLR